MRIQLVVSLIVLFVKSAFSEDCAYIQFENNFVFAGTEIKGTLITNRCNVNGGVVNVYLYDPQTNSTLGYVKLKADNNAIPFLLGTPENLKDGIYSVVGQVDKKTIFNFNYPVVSRKVILESYKNKDSTTSDNLVTTISKGISISSYKESSGQGNVLSFEVNLTSENSKTADLALKIIDKAQYAKGFIDIKRSDLTYRSENISPLSISASSLSLNGVLKDSLENVCAYCDILLTIPESEKGIFYTKTDLNGVFKFSGIYALGNTEAFLKYIPSSDKIRPENYHFIIQDDDELSFGSPLLTQQRLVGEYWNDQFQKYVDDNYNELLNYLLAEELCIEDKSVKKLSTLENSRVQLYSEYDKQVNFDNYVLGDDMRSTIKEIVPFVNFRKKDLRIFSPEYRQNFIQTPLILIDGIPTFDSELVLNMDPRTIKKVEILNRVRTLAKIGNIAGAGILSIFTKSGFDFRKIGNVEKLVFRGYDQMSTDLNENESRSNCKIPLVIASVSDLRIEKETPYLFKVQAPEYFIEPVLVMEGFTDNNEFVFFEGMLD